MILAWGRCSRPVMTTAHSPGGGHDSWWALDRTYGSGKAKFAPSINGGVTDFDRPRIEYDYLSI